MKFKEFGNWCHNRAADGCWDMLTAMACLDLYAKTKKIPFWKREREWRRRYEKRVMDEIVKPIEDKMKELSASK